MAEKEDESVKVEELNMLSDQSTDTTFGLHMRIKPKRSSSIDDDSLQEEQEETSEKVSVESVGASSTSTMPVHTGDTAGDQPKRPPLPTRAEDGGDSVKDERCSGTASSPEKERNGKGGDCDDSSVKDTEKDAVLEDISLFSYLYAELTRGYLMENDEAKFTEKRKRLYTFMKIPRELEKFMTYGFFQCVDAFIYLFTFLPIRFLIALVKFCIRGCLSTCISRRSRILEPAQICDLLKGVLLISCCFLMNYVDVSMMYHIIRGQAIIKLYIFYNMLEVADRLFSSFGQDILDSLFWTATEPRGRRREHVGILPHLLMAIIYVFLHSVLVLFQATCLNVAFNSHNKALLTIMMSNNFVELKGSVFKKFEKNNLFQMSCSDVRERFHLIVLLALVCVRNLTEFSWNMDHLWVLVPDVLLVMLSECMVDWVKHAFITKFNEISFEVYHDYTVSIAYDMAQSRQKNAFADHVDVVSRRMGFIPLPLAVILVRVIGHSVHIARPMDFLLLGLLFVCLTTFKVLNSIVLLGTATHLIGESKDQHKMAPPNIPPAKSTKDAGKVKRSMSVGENLNLSTGLSKSKKGSDIQSASLTPKVLFSNSTVSLTSVGLNEEFVKDTSTPLVAEGKTNKSGHPPKPLHEIDRYTMCSNRII